MIDLLILAAAHVSDCPQAKAKQPCIVVDRKGPPDTASAFFCDDWPDADQSPVDSSGNHTRCGLPAGTCVDSYGRLVTKDMTKRPK